MQMSYLSQLGLGLGLFVFPLKIILDSCSDKYFTFCCKYLFCLFVNFYLQHDPNTPECAPGDPDGNYIMFDKATSGMKANNDRFSKCSKDSIKQNVDLKRGKNPDCFIKSDTPICGNKIVEENEQCDCGDETTCTEKCCVPAGRNRECKLQENQQCSPSQGQQTMLQSKKDAMVI